MYSMSFVSACSWIHFNWVCFVSTFLSSIFVWVSVCSANFVNLFSFSGGFLVLTLVYRGLPKLVLEFDGKWVCFSTLIFIYFSAV